MLLTIVNLLWTPVLVLLSLAVAIASFIVFRYGILTIYRMWNYKRQGADFYYYPMIGQLKKMDNNFRITGDFCWVSKMKTRLSPTRMYVTNNGPNPHVLLHDPALIKEFLMNQDNYCKDPNTLDFFDVLLGEGLVKSHGKAWRAQRKTLASVFQFDAINKLMPDIKRVAIKNLTELQKDLTKEVNIAPTMNKIAGEVVGSLFFGDDIENFKYEGKPLTTALADLLNEVFSLKNTFERFYLGLWLSKMVPKHKRYLKKINDYRHACIEFVNQRKQLVDQNKGKKDLVQVLLEFNGEGSPISESLIVDQFISFFVPGLDTVGQMLVTSLYFLSLYPEHKEKVMGEIQAFYKNGESITIEDLNKYEFTTAFLKEVLRFAPPIIDLFPRKALRDHYLNDVLVKKGDLLNIDFLINNYNEAYFENPDTFNPSRWLDKEKNPQLFSYTPFSAGTRTCIGQHLALNEVKVVLSEFMTMYDFKVKEGYELKWMIKFVYGNFRPIPFILTPRNQTTCE